MIPPLVVGDLFSGMGGFALAARWMGWEKAFFSEIEPHASAWLAQHWPDVPNLGDITQIDWRTVEPIDFLCGGFPCQDLSLAGKGTGLAGARSGLWWEYHRAIKALRPRWILIENVPALRSRGLDVVLGSLAQIGYDAEWHCVPASALGAPHRRDRVWIVAYPGGIHRAVGRGDRDVAGPEDPTRHAGRRDPSDPGRPAAHHRGADDGRASAGGAARERPRALADASPAGQQARRRDGVRTQPGARDGSAARAGRAGALERMADAEEQSHWVGLRPYLEAALWWGRSGDVGGTEELADAARDDERHERRSVRRSRERVVAIGTGGRGTLDVRAEREEDRAEALDDRQRTGLQGHAGDGDQRTRRTRPDRSVAAASVRGGSEERRAAQSGLGRAADGLPPWMDGWHGWVAGPDEAQYSWEAPRVAEDVPHRRARLTAIGNSIVPQVAWVFMQAIQWAREDGWNLE